MKLGFVYSIVLTSILIGCGDGGSGARSVAIPANASPELASTLNRLNEIQKIFQQKSDEILKPHGIRLTMGIGSVETFDPAGEVTLKNLKSASADYSFSLLGKSDLAKVKLLEQAKMGEIFASVKYNADVQSNIKLEANLRLTADMFQLGYLATNKQLLPSNIDELMAIMNEASQKSGNKKPVFTRSGDSIVSKGSYPVGDQSNSVAIDTIVTAGGANVKANYEIKDLYRSFPYLKSSQYLESEKLFLTQFRSEDLEKLKTFLDESMREYVEKLR